MAWIPDALQSAEMPAENKPLPLLTCPAYDFANNAFIYDKDGAMQWVTKNEALKVWIYWALLTERNKFEVNSNQYGTEIYKVLGYPLSNGAKRAEIERYINETLIVCPYIEAVERVGLALVNGRLYISVLVKSIYEESWVEQSVRL